MNRVEMMARIEAAENLSPNLSAVLTRLRGMTDAEFEAQKARELADPRSHAKPSARAALAG